MKRAVLSVLFLGAACGPSAASYDADLWLSERCTTRASTERCETPADERETRTLVVDPQGEQVLLLLGEVLFLANAASPLAARRSQSSLDTATGCSQRSDEQLTVAQDLFGQVTGDYSRATVSEGPQGACGQTPFGERLRYNLSGVVVHP